MQQVVVVVVDMVEDNARKKTSMEVPNKIFLAFEHGFVAQASISKKDANGNNIFLPEYNPIEYLRKDILLEWAKELKFLLKDKSEPSFKGAEIIINEVIKKIQSL